MTSCGPASGFVGGDFSDLPMISIFGAFARIVRLNHIGAGGYFSAFGLRVQRSVDLSLRLTFHGKSQDAVAQALSISLPSSVSFAQWMPFTCDEELLRRHWAFRFCPACLRAGFHTLLHQLPWIEKCPWHGVRLRERCAICGSHILVSTDHGRLLTCSNGHDLLDEVRCCGTYFDQTNEAANFQEAYLAWAAQQRIAQHLLVPETPNAELASIAGIITLPSAFRQRCQSGRAVRRAGVHAQRLERKSGHIIEVRDQLSAFEKLAVLEKRTDGITVPSQMVDSLVTVSRELVGLLPPNTLSEREVSLFLCGRQCPGICHEPFASRKSIAEISFLPPLCIGDRCILNVNMVSKVSIATILRLIGLYRRRGLENQELGAQLLLRTVNCVLARAYAEGMRVVLARHFPILFDSKGTRPCISDPWVLVKTHESQLLRAVVAWVRRPELP